MAGNSEVIATTDLRKGPVLRSCSITFATGFGWFTVRSGVNFRGQQKRQFLGGLRSPAADKASACGQQRELVSLIDSGTMLVGLPIRRAQVDLSCCDIRLPYFLPQAFAVAS